ncbi:glycine receptor subunit alpha-2-like [Glandiceps talaboti]
MWRRSHIFGYLFILHVLLVFHIKFVSSETAEAIHDQHNASMTTSFLNDLVKTYDKRIRPFFDGPPVNVTVDMLVSRIDNVNDVTMDYGLTILLRQSWRDPRLAYDANKRHIPPTGDILQLVWVPDLFFTNEKKSHFHDVTRENILVRISPAGIVLYSARLSLTVSCHMMLSRFPMDEQHCKLKMESYSYEVEEMLFFWKEDIPIQREDDLELQQFEIQDEETLEVIHRYPTGNFSSLELHFTLSRKIGYYVISTFLPSSLLVVLSWVSFWINPEAAPARVALCITTVLTITTMAIAVRDELPKVSYVTAVDVWMSACLLFVFGSLVEFALVNFVSTLGKTKKSKVKLNIDVEKDGNDVAMVEKALNSTLDLGDHKQQRRWKHRASMVDKLARLLFPFMFILFNMFFWPIYKAESLHGWLTSE